ncbi:MAG TPA: hypothetical protein VLD67_11560 [Vicinamibacterales bacterium]|nr:hypothetical protein [Vicinamibacterales bacterium]
MRGQPAGSRFAPVRVAGIVVAGAWVGPPGSRRSSSEPHAIIDRPDSVRNTRWLRTAYAVSAIRVDESPIRKRVRPVGAVPVNTSGQRFGAAISRLAWAAAPPFVALQHRPAHGAAVEVAHGVTPTLSASLWATSRDSMFLDEVKDEQQGSVRSG